MYLCKLSTKWVFLIILPNSQQNTCAVVSFKKSWRLQACNFVQKKLQHRCFLVNFAKFFSTSFLQHTGQLLLSAEEFNLQTNYYSSECTLLEEQFVDSSHSLIFSYSIWVCILTFMCVLASSNLFKMKIKDWRSLMGPRSTNKRASAEHLINGN